MGACCSGGVGRSSRRPFARPAADLFVLACSAGGSVGRLLITHRLQLVSLQFTACYYARKIYAACMYRYAHLRHAFIAQQGLRPSSSPAPGWVGSGAGRSSRSRGSGRSRRQPSRARNRPGRSEKGGGERGGKRIKARFLSRWLLKSETVELPVEKGSDLHGPFHSPVVAPSTMCPHGSATGESSQPRQSTQRQAVGTPRRLSTTSSRRGARVSRRASSRASAGQGAIGFGTASLRAGLKDEGGEL